MPISLTCYACGRSAELDDAKRCSCGEPLWVDTEPDGFDWPTSMTSRLWRYADLLPYGAGAGLGAVAGGTPLLRATSLDEFGGACVHVKYEGANPTGSFKDRGSAVGVTHAVGTGRRAVGTVSHGNMAISMAAHAASVDLDCLVLVPEDIPVERLSILSSFDPTVIRVAGDYGRLYDDSLALGREYDVDFVNSDDPMRVAGQKTTALEICEAFAPETPDAIVLPVSSGGHASGVWKAIRELDVSGLLDEIPQLYFVQSAACAPIAEAFDSGADRVSRTTAGETIAYSIANADPPSGTRALAGVRATGGGVVTVEDEEIRAAQRALGESAGLCVETASATGLAATRNLTAAGALDSSDNVVVVATGSGFAEATGGKSMDAPVVERADLDDVFASL